MNGEKKSSESGYEKSASEILERAKAEAEAIIAAARAAAEVKASPRKRSPRGEEEVTYTFFKDNGEYSDDVFLSVNCEKIVCQRGVPVRIKRKFVWAYEQAMRQRDKAAQTVEEHEMRFERRAKESRL